MSPSGDALRVFAAVDLGASGGRVIAGVVDRDGVDLQEVHRFGNGATERDAHLRWDLTALFDEVRTGLARLAVEFPEVESIGIDTWGCDYGLLDADGRLLGEPISHRDGRTAAGVDAVHGVVPPAELFAVNGLQFLPFTTLYQLAAERTEDRWGRAAHVVLLPDLLAFWLTGQLRTEATNASTTGLIDAATGDWSPSLMAALDLPVDRFPPLDRPGEVRGAVLPDVAKELGLGAGTVVTSVGSHDTASAVAAVPATGDGFAYIASGTWSLVGVELPGPILSEESRAARFTNEAGVDGRTRFLRNVGGLWLLQECMRSWADEGRSVALEDVLAAAEALGTGGPTIDVDDDRFIPPGAMPDRIAAAVAERGAAPPTTEAELVRCILDSLALGYASTIRRAAALAGREVETVHLVGGGARNELLCRLTAEATGRPVVAGPVEATALGNVLVQARAHGALSGSLDDLRATVAPTSVLARYEPAPTSALQTKLAR